MFRVSYDDSFGERRGVGDLSQLITTSVDIRMRPKLLLQQRQCVQRDVRIALRNVEIHALQFLNANCLVARFVVRAASQFDCYVRLQHPLRVGLARQDAVERRMMFGHIHGLCR